MRILGNTPPTVRYLLIINGLLLALTYAFANFFSFDLYHYLALFYFKSDYFKPFQFITHMFMHADIWHLLFNMYALWMFGMILERRWGSQKFLFYYLFTGLGAAVLHTFVSWYQISDFISEANNFIANPTPDIFSNLVNNFPDKFRIFDTSSYLADWFEQPSNPGMINGAKSAIESIIQGTINVPTVGASGAVFGVLLAFGMLFPNVELYLMFIPIPIKAKYFVIGYGLIELFYGTANIPGDNVAHFAHLGGMIFGFILIRYWNRKSRNY